MNPLITKKERGLIKGALRRVFSRSDIRREVLDSALIEHKDENRPRVTKWVKCAICKSPYPKYKSAVDHIDPVIPIGGAFEDMTLDDLLNRLWCSKLNLQVVCEICHKSKSKRENKERREYKKRRKSK